MKKKRDYAKPAMQVYELKQSARLLVGSSGGNGGGMPGGQPGQPF